MYWPPKLDNRFLNGSLSNILKQGLSLNLDLTDVASLAGQLARGFLPSVFE